MGNLLPNHSAAISVRAKKDHRDINGAPKDGEPINGQVNLSKIFKEEFKEHQELYKALPEDKRRAIGQLFGSNENFMDSATTGANWVDDMVQDEDFEALNDTYNKLMLLWD